jgi:hypothetical protein
VRVLILTNHFANYAGSEIVALEVAQWFRDQADEVTLAANYIGAPIDAHAQDIALTREIETLALGDFDLIWCQHDLLALLPIEAFERAATGKLAHIALVSLSPYEPFEHVDAALARALSADVLANSPETRAEMLRRGAGDLEPTRVRVFHNAAPEAFWRNSNTALDPSSALRSVTLISNHVPQELAEARALLERAGIATLHLGLGGDVCRLVGPDDIAAADAVISIGKSVPYAIAQRKPVYMYDVFGGEGWLTRANASESLAHNFSGRPTRRRLDAGAIVAELTDGFASAAKEAGQLADAINVAALRLDPHLSSLRRRALCRSEGMASWRLRHALAQPTFRAHLETLRAKSSVMKRYFLTAQARA